MRAMLGASIILNWTKLTMASASSYLLLCLCFVFWMQVQSLPSQLADVNHEGIVKHELDKNQITVQGRGKNEGEMAGWFLFLVGLISWFSLVGIKALAFKALLAGKIALTLGLITLMKKLSFGASGKGNGGIYFDPHSGIEGYESPPWETGTLDFHSGGQESHSEPPEEWPAHIINQDPVYKPYKVQWTPPKGSQVDYHTSFKPQSHKEYPIHESQSISHEEEENPGYQSWDSSAIQNWNEQYNEQSEDRGYNHMQFSDSEENSWDHVWEMDNNGLTKKSDDASTNQAEWKPIATPLNDTQKEKT